MAVLAQTLREPRLPQPPQEWAPEYQAAFNQELRIFFRQLVTPYAANLGSLNINIDSLPTEADLATLRSGDVYRDTTALHVLKVKP